MSRNIWLSESECHSHIKIITNCEPCPIGTSHITRTFNAGISQSVGLHTGRSLVRVLHAVILQSIRNFGRGKNHKKYRLENSSTKFLLTTKLNYSHRMVREFS